MLKTPGNHNNPLQPALHSGIRKESITENIMSLAEAVKTPQINAAGQVASKSAIVVSFIVLYEWNNSRGVSEGWK